jgi:hypothetical protein
MSEGECIEVRGVRLKCADCGGSAFTKRRRQLNTAFITFLDLDWPNRSADIFVCSDCGRLEWFLPPTPYQESDDAADPTACLSCGATIPERKDECSKCGWTYKA